MKPAPFDYHAPATLEEALRLLEALGEGASLLAGGQTLVPLLNMRLARPAAIVDLNRIPDLAGIRRDGAELAIGAMTRHMTLEHDPLAREHVPLLAEAARHIAHLQVRTRGTIGGSLANAAAAAEWPAAVAALDGRLVVRSRSGGTRTLAPEEFFTGAMMTTLAADEVLVEIRIPIPPAGAGWAFVEFARRHGDFALAGAAAVVQRDGTGRIGRARLALCGMSQPGVRLRAAEAALVGSAASDADLDRVEDIVRDGVDAQGDVQLSAESRREVAATVARRCLARAIGRAGAAGRA